MNTKNEIVTEFWKKENEHTSLLHELKDLKLQSNDLDPSHICDTFYGIIGHVKRHNTSEEELMIKLSYNDTHPHTLAHKEIESELEIWYGEYMSSLIDADELVDKAASLLSSHIKVFDSDINWFAMLNA